MMCKTYFQNGFLFILSMIFFGCLSLHFRQDINWDLLNYHLYNPYAFLHNRLGQDIAPAFMHTYFNPFLDLVNYFLIMTQKPIIVSFALGAISGITAFFVYKIGLMCFEKWWLALFGMLIGMTGYAGITQLGATTNETKTACLMTIAVYFLLRIIRQPEISIKGLIGSGLLLGITMGLKLTATPIVLGIVVGFMIVRPTLKSSSIFIISIGMGFLISNGCWMYILYNHFQNPLFPFYNNLFHSPYAEIANYKDERFIPRDLLHFLFLPYFLVKKNQLCTEVLMQDPRLAVAYTLVFIFLAIGIINFFKKTEKQTFSRETKFLFITFMVAYLFWLIQFSIYRYTIMLEIISGLLIVFSVSYFFKKRMLQVILLIVLIAAIQKNTAYADWGHVKFSDSYFDIHPIPSLPPDALVVILENNDPLAYLVPYIASDRRVIGISGYLNPANKNASQKEVKNLILSFKGPLYSISVMNIDAQAQGYLNYYHLKQDSSDCIVIHSKVKDVLFCPLKRIP